jgi:hypothetical protein
MTQTSRGETDHFAGASRPDSGVIAGGARPASSPATPLAARLPEESALLKAKTLISNGNGHAAPYLHPAAMTAN